MLSADDLFLQELRKVAILLTRPSFLAGCGGITHPPPLVLEGVLLAYSSGITHVSRTAPNTLLVMLHGTKTAICLTVACARTHISRQHL